MYVGCRDKATTDKRVNQSVVEGKWVTTNKAFVSGLWKHYLSRASVSDVIG
jgi:hypothetical protein